MKVKKFSALALDFLLSVGCVVSFLLTPILLVQGYWLRKKVLRLPDAEGSKAGNFPGKGKPVHILALGESTISGVGVSDHTSGFTTQIAKSLASMTGLPVKWEAFGKNGASASTARSELVRLIPQTPVDVVILALGVNDILELHSVHRWISDLNRLVDEIRIRVGAVPIVLASVPPMGKFPAFPQPLRSVLGLRAFTFDRALICYANKSQKVFHSKDKIEQSLETFFCADRVHPSASGYAEWGQQVAKTIKKILI